MPENREHYIVKITKSAKNDIRSIVSFIAKNNPQTAVKILERIEAKINTLSYFPNKGGYVPELLKRNIKEYRQVLESPWRIIYRVNKNIVTVLVVIDSRRNTQDILLQRLLK